MSEEKVSQQLFAVLAALENEQEVGLFLQDLCTPAELKAMADRWRVVDSIKRGVPYRKIHEATGVSVSTITRVARYIAYGEGGYDLAYNKTQGKENT